jgi:predicted PurR-regulated permease PerM
MSFQKLAAYFQGRHTLYIVTALLTGIVMSWFGKLDANLVALLLGLGGLVLGHSVKESVCQ